jgi:hypothetical protein
MSGYSLLGRERAKRGQVCTLVHCHVSYEDSFIAYLLTCIDVTWGGEDLK